MVMRRFFASTIKTGVVSGFPLDGLSGFSIYSLNRNMLSSYEGPLFELTRDVTFETLDVYADESTNFVDVSEIPSFSDGEIVKLSKVYDNNTSLNNHAVQLSFGNMPEFYNSGFYIKNERYCAKFFKSLLSGSRDYLTFTNDVEMAGKIVFAVAQTETISIAETIMSGGNINTQFRFDEGGPSGFEQRLLATGSPNNIGVPLIEGVNFNNLGVAQLKFESGVESGVFWNNSLSDISATANTTFILKQIGDRTGAAQSEGFDGNLAEFFFLDISELAERSNVVDELKEFYQIS